MNKPTDISIQFYATPSELFTFVKDMLAIGNVFAVSVVLHPFAVGEFNADSGVDLSSNAMQRRIYFSLAPIPITKSKLDLEKAIQDPLVLDIGRLDCDGLWESWLACRAFDELSLTAWKKIAKDLKHRTEAGITATNRVSDLSQYYKSFRFTTGAMKLQGEGVCMVPAQGANGPAIRLGK